MTKKTELFIVDFPVDLFGDEAFLLNYNVTDITDISVKVGAYSKEIDIPATKLNNQNFSHLYDVNSEGYFNPITKKAAEVYVDGVCVMKGFFKLNGVTVIDKEYVTYHGVLFEDTLNFTSALGELQLGNLSLPFTGSTPSVSGPTTPTSFLMDGYYGTDFQNASFYNPGNVYYPYYRKYNANATQITIPIPGYGALQPIPKDASLFTNSSFNQQQATSNQNINAFIASVPCTLTLTAEFTNSYLYYARQVGYVKVTQNSSGVWSHTQINPPGILFNSQPSLLPPQNNPTTFTLQAGEGFYYYFRDAYWRSVPGFSAYPIPLNLPPTTSKVFGTIAPAGFTTNPFITLTPQFILDNHQNVGDYDDSDICFPLIDYNQGYPYEAKSEENSTPVLNIPFEDLRPAVFVKKIWDAIFEQSGFKYKSKFIEDTGAELFKKLICIGGMEETDVQTPVYGRNLDFILNLVEPIQDDNVYSGSSIIGYDYQSYLLGGYNGVYSTVYNNLITLKKYSEVLLISLHQHHQITLVTLVHCMVNF